MSGFSSRSGLTVLVATAVTVVLTGCAVERTGAMNDAAPATPAVHEVPSPDYSVFYWQALRTCLRSGRSELECRSGQDPFVRDALAFEAALNDERRQRRETVQARAAFAESELTPEPDPAVSPTRRTRSVLLDWQPEATRPSCGDPIIERADPLARHDGPLHSVVVSGDAGCATTLCLCPESP